MPNRKALYPMDTPTPAEIPADAMEQSFDIVARQDQAEADIATLRTDVDEVKARLDKVSRAASRPAIGGAPAKSEEVKGFVDGYLRRGRETEVKSINAANPAGLREELRNFYAHVTETDVDCRRMWFRSARSGAPGGPAGSWRRPSRRRKPSRPGGTRRARPWPRFLFQTWLFKTFAHFVRIQRNLL